MNKSVISPAKIRYPQIDIARGIAVIAMIVYHILFDLAFLEIAPIPLHSPFMRAFQISIATLFLVISGISSAIFLSKGIQAAQYFKRTAVIAGAAAFVSLGSWLAFPSLTIVMGILHLIAFSTIFLFFVKNLSTRLLLFLAVLISAFGSLILTLDLRGPTNILLGFGIPYYSFQTLDYYPLLPWFGVVLAGFVIGRNLPLYLNLQKELSPINRFLGATGRHSLIIYLFHQPILLALLFPFT